MKPVMQTKRGGADAPPEERGDCLPACVASILEINVADVPIPHVADWYTQMQVATARHGYRILWIDYPNRTTADALGHWIGPAYWIAGVPSKNLGPGIGHVIVMHGAEVVHDPCLGDRYPAGPLGDEVKIDAALILFELVPRAPLADFKAAA